MCVGDCGGTSLNTVIGIKLEDAQEVLSVQDGISKSGLSPG